MQASYTYIDSQGLPNSRLNGGSPVNNAPNRDLRQSAARAAVRAQHQRGRLLRAWPDFGRVAYNWRSKFLLTSADVIFPYFPIFNDDTGQLDASIFFAVTPEIKIGVQG
jgi:hypothetical protein